MHFEFCILNSEPGSRARLGHVFAVLLAAAAVASLSSAFLLGSTPDEEEFRFAVLSAWLRVHALAGGDHAFWTPLLGFGIPQPFVPNFTLHPLLPLLGLLHPVSWARLFLVVHTAIGAIGMWWLGGGLALAPIVRSTCVVTFLFAAPVQNYVLSDFWPSHYLVWTLSPWLLGMAWRLLSTDAIGVRRWSCGLGLAAGLVAANSNPAYLLVFTPMAAVTIAVSWRMAATRWRALALSALVALAIAAPTIAQLASERMQFAPALALSNVTDPLSWRSALASAFAPFTQRTPDTRSVFFGAPYAVLALIGFLSFARVRRDLTLAVVLVGLLLLTTWLPVPWISQRYQFRDPLTLCAILLAGLALNDMWRSARLHWIAATLVMAQVGSVAFAASPLLQRMWDAEGRRAVAFRGATGATPLVDALVARTRIPGRLLYSPHVDYDVAQRALLPEGLGINALAYRGIAVVNGSFKGVSADTMWPDDRLFYGRVRAPPQLVTSGQALDVLAVRYVLAYRGEPVATDLTHAASARTARGGELVLLENKDAWAGVFLVDATFGDTRLPLVEGCSHERLLCRDLSTLVPHRDPRPINIQRRADSIRVTFAPSESTAILVASEMFRPEWVATSGNRRLHTRAMYGGLLGVPLPPGVADVRLDYRPTAMIYATLACYVALVAGLGMLYAWRAAH